MLLESKTKEERKETSICDRIGYVISRVDKAI